jgi:hypothetical protein
MGDLGMLKNLVDGGENALAKEALGLFQNLLVPILKAIGLLIFIIRDVLLGLKDLPVLARLEVVDNVISIVQSILGVNASMLLLSHVLSEDLLVLEDLLTVHALKAKETTW